MCCDKDRNMQIRGVWQKAVQNRIRVMKSTSPDRTRRYVQFPSPRALRARDLCGISIFRRSQFRLPLSSTNCSLIELPLPVARPFSAPNSNPCPLRALDTFSSRVLVLRARVDLSKLLCQEISPPFATFFYQLLIDLTSYAQLLNLSRIPFQSVWTLFI